MRYLEPYGTATAAIEEKVDRLKLLTADNPRQQARILPLQQHIQDGAPRIEAERRLGQKDLEAARRAVISGAGNKALDAIRLQVGEMEQEERDLLRERELQSRSSYRVAAATGFFAALLGLGMVGASLLSCCGVICWSCAQTATLLYEQREWFRTTLLPASAMP